MNKSRWILALGCLGAGGLVAGCELPSREEFREAGNWLVETAIDAHAAERGGTINRTTITDNSQTQNIVAGDQVNQETNVMDNRNQSVTAVDARDQSLTVVDARDQSLTVVDARDQSANLHQDIDVDVDARDYSTTIDTDIDQSVRR